MGHTAVSPNLEMTRKFKRMTDLYFIDQGKGKTLVLIHSGGTDLRDWENIAPELFKKYRVIMYDQRGAGQSPVPIEPTNHITDLKILLDSNSLEQVILIGHSIGGQIATDFALKHPERVEKLILIAPGLTGYKYDSDFQTQTKRIWEVVPDIDKMLDIMLNTPKAYAVEIGMSSPQKDRIIEVHRHNIEKSLTWKNIEQIWIDPPTIEKLKDIRPDILFILGTQDKKDLFNIKTLFKQLDNAKFVNIENADHVLTWTHPKELLTAIRGFVD